MLYILALPDQVLGSWRLPQLTLGERLDRFTDSQAAHKTWQTATPTPIHTYSVVSLESLIYLSCPWNEGGKQYLEHTWKSTRRTCSFHTETPSWAWTGNLQGDSKNHYTSVPPIKVNHDACLFHSGASEIFLMVMLHYLYSSLKDYGLRGKT